MIHEKNYKTTKFIFKKCEIVEVYSLVSGFLWGFLVLKWQSRSGEGDVCNTSSNQRLVWPLHVNINHAYDI